MHDKCTIIPFESPEFGEIRTVIEDGEPWFVAKDVCKALNHSNTAMAVKALDDDEKGITKVYTPSGEQDMLTVSEPGLYGLVLRSHKPEAKAFKRWITHEVIPSIRKRGGYMVAREEETPEQVMARALLLAKDALEAKDKQISEMKPKALFADAVATSDRSILVGEMAKILKQNGVENMGQNRLFKWLRENGYLMQRGGHKNMPTQRSMEMGLFEVKETAVTHSDGHVTMSLTPKITGKGQQYLVNKLMGEKVSA